MRNEQALQQLADGIVDSLRPEVRLTVGRQYWHTKNGRKRRVQIMSGSWLGADRGICNFWTWQPVQEDGSFGPVEKGYDNEGAFSEIAEADGDGR